MSSRANSQSSLRGSNPRLSGGSPASSTVKLVADSNKDENVIVSVRVRPLSESEQQSKEAHIWDLVPGPYGKIMMQEDWKDRLRKAAAEYQFGTKSTPDGDHVFGGSDNAELYNDCVSELVCSAMEGYSATVFAYGQTSSGKTYTMMGKDEEPGVIPRAISDVFDYISETRDQREFLLRVSYMEVYNESIKDLLAPENIELKIHEDKHRGVYVSPLREDIVTSPEQVFNLIQKGERNRHVSSTDYNTHSSRSHTIFQLIIESRERNQSTTNSPNMVANRKLAVQKGPVRFSTLNLIDLAGSEKASSSVDRRREGAYINKSLLTLGNVISKLTEEKAGHIPYRDSKLTRILQPSLQGTCRVSVICTVSPAAGNQEESTNTLKFAQRIKQVKVRAERREIMDDKALLQKYRFEIEELRTKLMQLSNKETESSQLAAEKLRLEEELHQQQLVRIALKERIDHLTKLILTSSSYNTQAVTNAWNPAENDQAATSTRETNRKSKRMSFVIDTKRGPEIEKLEEALAQRSIEIERMQRQNDALSNTITQKDGYITQLLQEIQTLRAASSATTTDSVVQSLQREIHELKRTNEDLKKQLALSADAQKETALVNLDSSVSLTHQAAIDPDKFDEMAHELDISKERVAELEQETRQQKQRIQQLEAQSGNSSNTTAANNESSPSFSPYTDIYRNYTPAPSETPPPKKMSIPEPPNVDKMFSKSSPSPSLKARSRVTSNADLLTNLLRSQSKDQFPDADLPPPIKSELNQVTKSIGEGTNTGAGSDEVEREKSKRLQMAKASSERMAELETELTIAQAELSVAQLLLNYSPNLQRRKSSLRDSMDPSRPSTESASSSVNSPDN